MNVSIAEGRNYQPPRRSITLVDWRRTRPHRDWCPPNPVTDSPDLGKPSGVTWASYPASPRSARPPLARLALAGRTPGRAATALGRLCCQAGQLIARAVYLGHLIVVALILPSRIVTSDFREGSMQSNDYELSQVQRASYQLTGTWQQSLPSAVAARPGAVGKSQSC